MHIFWWFHKEWALSLPSLTSTHVEMASALQLLGAVSLVLLLYWGAVQAGPKGRFLVLWWLVGLLPFTLFPVGWVGHRYLYMAEMGTALLTALALVKIHARACAYVHPSWQRVASVGIAGFDLTLGAAVMARQAINHMSYRTDSGEINRAFLIELKAAIPELPEGGTLYIYGAPRDLSLYPNDGFYLIPAVGLWYGRSHDIRVGESMSESPQGPPDSVFRWNK